MIRIYLMKTVQILKLAVAGVVFGVMTALLAPPATVNAAEPLSLGDAIERALEENYSIRIRAREHEVAETNNSWGAAGRYPTIKFNLSGNTQYNFNEGPDVSSTSMAPGVALNWVLFDGFAVTIRKERLDLFEALSSGNTTVLVESTVQSVIQAYYNTLFARQKLNVLSDVRDLSRDRYDYMLNRQEIGHAVTYDVLQAKNAWLEDTSRYLQQEVTVRANMRDLAYLMGDDNAPDYQFTEALEPPESNYLLEDLKERMLSGNSNLKNQYIGTLLLGEDVRLARSNYLPTVSLSSGLDTPMSRSKTEGAPATTREWQDIYAGFTLSLPLFDGGSRKRAVQVAHIEERIGGIETENLRHSLVNQLDNLYDLYTVQQRLIEVAEENLDAAKLNLSISDDRLRAGTITSFNYRDVQLIYLNASLALLQEKLNIINTNTALMKITGGILSEQ